MTQRRIEQVVVVPPAHRWARRRRPLPLDVLAAEPLVLREPGSGTRDALEDVLSAAGLKLRTAVELGSTAAVKTAAMNGEGPAVLSELSVTAELLDGRLCAVAIDGIQMHRPFRAIWHLDQPPTGTAVAMLAAAGSHWEEPASAGDLLACRGRASNWPRGT